jgi:uncharacterized membrane protein YdjX (TVP38/TMEM64 family)
LAQGRQLGGGASKTAGIVNQTGGVTSSARLAALVPKPGVSLTRFHGVFAPNSQHRAIITPGASALRFINARHNSHLYYPDVQHSIEASMKTSSPARIPRRFRSPLWAIAASILFVAAILGVLIYFDVHERLLVLLQWVDEQGLWAAVLFILIMAIVVVLLLPGILFTTGAGFVFGLVNGTVYVVVGTTLGAAIAFLVARYTFGERARRFIIEHSRLRVVNEEMTRHDWKVVLLTRLIPFFPSKIANYFFGLTGFSFRGYLLGSLVGFIPFSLHNVYLGSIAADLAALSEREIGRTPVEWTLYATGFVATVVAILYFNRLARTALRRYTEESDSKEGLS